LGNKQRIKFLLERNLKTVRPGGTDQWKRLRLEFKQQREGREGTEGLYHWGHWDDEIKCFILHQWHNKTSNAQKTQQL
jgi:hypothetical protein